MTWRLDSYSAGPDAIPAETLVTTMLVARWAWRRMTGVQRAAVQAGRATHPLTVRALAGHGICDETGQLTRAGQAVRRWGPPAGSEEIGDV